jgi:hypothetical protein
MAPKKVHVYENDDEYRVHPPVIELDGGVPDDLIVRNNTGDDLVVYFPAKSVNAAPLAVSLEKNKKITVTALSQTAGNSNAFPYQVIAPKSGKKAKGNSDPVLIIEN